MFKDIAKTVEKARAEVYKHPCLFPDVADMGNLTILHKDAGYSEIFIDAYSLGFLQGQKAAKKSTGVKHEKIHIDR